ncbi:MAG: aminotransferase class IV [Thermodesulfobacteriota bacterium]
MNSSRTEDDLTDEARVFVNGAFLPSNRATISVFDRGLTYGDGLFETIRAYNGRPFALDRHISRLRRGLDELAIPFTTETAFEETITKLLKLNHLDSSDAYIRITVTRGADHGGLLPSEEIEPTIIIVAKRVDTSKIELWQRKGISVSFIEGYLPPLPHMKTLNYLPSLMAKMEAVRRGADEGLFVRNGLITEGTTSNIFTVKDGILSTPPADGIACRESPLTVTEFLESDEAFMSNAIAEIAPVVAVDGHRVGDGEGGSTTRLLQRAYMEMAQADL